MQINPSNDPAPRCNTNTALPDPLLSAGSSKRYRPAFDDLLAEQVLRRREAGLSDLTENDQTRRERMKVMTERTAQSIANFTAHQQEIAELHAAAFDNGAEYARQRASGDTLFWVITGALLGGSLTWWLLRLGGSAAAGA